MSNYEEELKALTKSYSKRVLSIQDLSKVFGVSEVTIRRGIELGKNIPPFKKFGGGDRPRVMFPITEVARFLATPEKIH